MENRLKIRAWHKKHKQMANVEAIDFREDLVEFENAITISGKWGVCYNAQLPEVILMQCTGLFDKNGKLIYEGDIVEYEFNKMNYRIEFLNGEFLLRRKFKNIEDITMCDCDYGNEIEIIGNKFEHSHLLGEAQ